MVERWRGLKVLLSCVLVLKQGKGGGRSISLASSKVKITATTTTKQIAVRGKAAKKVFSLPGQKFDPSEREPLGIFYESLSKQIQTSEMAEFWGWEANTGGGSSHENNHCINDDDDDIYDNEGDDISGDKHYDPYGDE